MSKKNKNENENPKLSHESITKQVVLAVNVLMQELSEDPQKYSRKTLKTILEDIQNAFDRMFAQAGSQNKNSAPSRIYATQYQWVINKINEIKQ